MDFFLKGKEKMNGFIHSRGCQWCCKGNSDSLFGDSSFSPMKRTENYQELKRIRKQSAHPSIVKAKKRQRAAGAPE